MKKSLFSIPLAFILATTLFDPPIVIASSSESRASGFLQMTKSGNELIFAWTDDKEKKVKTARIKL
ncbi:MAG: hypothetical protein ABJH04_09175 [Cyclobacteriaceae bacterium]